MGGFQKTLRDLNLESAERLHKRSLTKDLPPGFKEAMWYRDVLFRTLTFDADYEHKFAHAETRPLERILLHFKDEFGLIGKSMPPADHYEPTAPTATFVCLKIKDKRDPVRIYRKICRVTKKPSALTRKEGELYLYWFFNEDPYYERDLTQSLTIHLTKYIRKSQFEVISFEKSQEAPFGGKELFLDTKTLKFLSRKALPIQHIMDPHIFYAGFESIAPLVKRNSPRGSFDYEERKQTSLYANLHRYPRFLPQEERPLWFTPDGFNNCIIKTYNKHPKKFADFFKEILRLKELLLDWGEYSHLSESEKIGMFPIDLYSGTADAIEGRLKVYCKMRHDTFKNIRLAEGFRLKNDIIFHMPENIRDALIMDIINDPEYDNFLHPEFALQKRGGIQKSQRYLMRFCMNVCNDFFKQAYLHPVTHDLSKIKPKMYPVPSTYFKSIYGSYGPYLEFFIRKFTKVNHSYYHGNTRYFCKKYCLDTFRRRILKITNTYNQTCFNHGISFTPEVRDLALYRIKENLKDIPFPNMKLKMNNRKVYKSFKVDNQPSYSKVGIYSNLFNLRNSLSEYRQSVNLSNDSKRFNLIKLKEYNQRNNYLNKYVLSNKSNKSNIVYLNNIYSIYKSSELSYICTWFSMSNYLLSSKWGYYLDQRRELLGDDKFYTLNSYQSLRKVWMEGMEWDGIRKNFVKEGGLELEYML